MVAVSNICYGVPVRKSHMQRVLSNVTWVSLLEIMDLLFRGKIRVFFSNLLRTFELCCTVCSAHYAWIVWRWTLFVDVLSFLLILSFNWHIYWFEGLYDCVYIRTICRHRRRRISICKHVAINKPQFIIVKHVCHQIVLLRCSKCHTHTSIPYMCQGVFKNAI
jgi:hypothetical protein